MNLKKVKSLLAVLIAFVSVSVFAASTPVQTTVTTTTGSATYTQSLDHVVFAVSRVELFGALPISSTAMVRRVSGGLTNTLGTIVVTTGAGAMTNFTEYVFKGDTLVFSGAGTNSGASLRITGVELP